MTESAAERIVIDESVLISQRRTLQNASRSLSAGVGPAQATLASTSFGVINSFLASALNGMASRTGELVAEAAEMSKRMSGAVDSALATYAAHEEQASAEFAKFAETSGE